MKGKRWMVAGVVAMVIVALLVGSVLAGTGDELEVRAWLPLVMGGSNPEAIPTLRPTPTAPIARPTPTCGVEW